MESRRLLYELCWLATRLIDTYHASQGVVTTVY